MSTPLWVFPATSAFYSASEPHNIPDGCRAGSAFQAKPPTLKARFALSAQAPIRRSL